MDDSSARLVDALYETLIAEDPGRDGAALNLTASIDQGATQIAGALRDLGLSNAGTSMGALEVLAMEIKEGSRRIADSLSDIAEALHEIAQGLPRDTD